MKDFCDFFLHYNIDTSINQLIADSKDWFVCKSVLDQFALCTLKLQDLLDLCTLKPQDFVTLCTLKPQDLVTLCTLKPQDHVTLCTLNPQNLVTLCTLKPQDHGSPSGADTDIYLARR